MTHAEGDGESLLEELWTTPVGRRWVLEAGLASAVALGAAGHGARRAEPARAARQRRRRRRETRHLHFALGHLRGVTELTLAAGATRLPLRRHTKASRAALEREGGIWQAADLARLSHHVTGVDLSAERAMVLTVYGKRGRRDVVVGHLMHVPQATTRALARAAGRGNRSFRAVAGPARRLAALGLERSDIRSARHVVQLDSVGDGYTTATTIAMMHPNVATIDKTAAGATKTLLAQTPAVGALGRTITGMQDRGRNFGSLVQATDADGNPAQITVGDTTTTFKTFQFSSDPDFRQGLKSAVSAAVTGVRDTGSLGAVIDQPLELQPAAATKTWVQSQGVAPQPRPYADAALLGSGLSIQVKNTGDVFGTKTVVSGGYSNGQVPLTLYNNWVRWIWVYVQYLGPGDANLSANPNASFPDTKYSQSVGLLSQVNTILGVPLWGTNSINVTLDYPEGAHTARLLFCGLGSDLSGGGWRQYFPADAYPGKIAPQDEVLVPALLTGILTIGLTVFSLVTDLNAATAFIAIKEPTSELAKAGVAIFDAILALGLPVGEAVAVDVAAGNASAAVNGPNIFNLLLPLAAGIPKVLFTPEKAPAWGRIGAAVAGVEGESAVLAAIPVIGEVLEVIDVLGDVATLAEECAETIVAPWVIENEVNLTYPATVTVSIDRSQASTFPVTAVSWSLEAKVDGAVTLDPITGSINDGGRIRSDPLVLSVTAPFGGQQIQWSIVFLDSAGRQVGTGVSAGAANDDPSNPPSSVSITIQQIPATITSATRFKRSDTTGYSTAAGGYTWSNQITDSGTLADKGIQEVAGTAISTLAGVAGVVWEQDDRFYLRGVPVAENGDDDRARPGDRPGLRAAPVPPARPVRRARRPGQPRAARARPRDPGVPRPPGRAGRHHRRADLGLLGVVGDVPAADLGRRAALVGARGGGEHRQRPRRHAAAGRRGAAPAGGLHRRARHPGRVAELPGRRCGHEPRHRAGARSRRAPDRRLRPQRRPGPLLHRRHRLADPARAGDTRARRPGHRAVHAAAGDRGQLPGPGRRRRRPDLRPLLHRRRQRAVGVPDRRVRARPAPSWTTPAPASTSRTSRSTTGAASTPPTTTRSPTRSPASRASTPRSASRSRRSAASIQPSARRSRGCGAASGRGRADDAPRARRRATRPRVAACGGRRPVRTRLRVLEQPAVRHDRPRDRRRRGRQPELHHRAQLGSATAGRRGRPHAHLLGRRPERGPRGARRHRREPAVHRDGAGAESWRSTPITSSGRCRT